MPAADIQPQTSLNQRGYTLVELVIGIVVFGTALVLLSTTLFPMFAQSANPHYQARAAALGQAVMNQALARPFDKNSDANGSRWRCGEDYTAVTALGIVAPNPIPACSNSLTARSRFTALEDYICCWGIEDICTQTYRGALSKLVGSETDEYDGFTVNIDVTYDPDDGTKRHKRIDVTVDTGRFGRFDFSAYRSNF